MSPRARPLPHALLVVTAALACRPHGAMNGPPPVDGREPLPAASALVNASVQVTLRAAVGALADVPLPVQSVNEEAGIVETEYQDLSALVPRIKGRRPVERVVRFQLRVRPDTLGRGARLVVLALYRPRGGDQSAGGAEERTVPRDHPAAAFARQLVEKIERKALAR